MQRNRIHAASVVVLLYGITACASTPTRPAKPAEKATVTVSATATPTPTVTVTAKPTGSAAAAKRRGSSAAFENFRVTITAVEYPNNSEALVQAKVCVTSLPADPQGNKTRISWDPWSVTAGTRATQAAVRGSLSGRLFPSDQTYEVGQCASGWIPFPIQGELDIIRYANGVGDKAVWDADHLSQNPVTRHVTQAASSDQTPSVIGEGTYIVGDDMQPGRYQARANRDGLCYWARLKDDSGDFDSIIANDGTAGRASVTIESTDGAFESSGCTPWIRQ